MAEQIQELIDKIKQEGIQQADQKAQEIENRAKQKAEAIIKDAEAKAEKLIREAKEQNQKTEKSSRLALQQASRDMMIALRGEIQKTLQKVVEMEVKETLSADKLLSVIESAVKVALQNNIEGKDIQVDVGSKDFQAVKDGILDKFKKEMKQPLTVKASEDIGKGFTVSFDKGKSSFDFSDESLAGYLAAYLTPQVAALLQAKE